MTGLEIIKEIRQLPPEEWQKVNNFMREQLEPGQLPAEELAELTRQMVEASDPKEAERLKQLIFRGFYGDAGPDA